MEPPIPLVWHFIYSVLLFTAVGSPASGDEFLMLNLQMRKNQEIPGYQEDNRLDGLLTGEQTMAGVKFRIGKGVIQLGSTVRDDGPEKVEGIAAAGLASKLHFLHATQYGGGPFEAGSSRYVEDGVLVGHYVVRYKDKTEATIPIVYGQDVRDWWFRPGKEAVTRGTVAWTGDNELAKQYECRLCLYLTSWKNPKPDVAILTIDYHSKKTETPAAPFCVAITMEKP